MAWEIPYTDIGQARAEKWPSNIQAAIRPIMFCAAVASLTFFLWFTEMYILILYLLTYAFLLTQPPYSYRSHTSARSLHQYLQFSAMSWSWQALVLDLLCYPGNPLVSNSSWQCNYLSSPSRQSKQSLPRIYESVMRLVRGGLLWLGCWKVHLIAQ